MAHTIPQADSSGVVAALRDEFDDNELTSFVALLFTSAVDTGAVAIGFSLVELAGNMPLQSLLRSHPNQVGAFADEAGRLNPPITTCLRASLTEDDHWRGHIAGGYAVCSATASAQPRRGHRHIDSRQPGPIAALVHLRRRHAALPRRAPRTRRDGRNLHRVLRRIPEFRTADGYNVLDAEVDRYLTHLPLVW